MINTEVRFGNVDKGLDEFGTVLRNVQASIQSLENQVGQLARAQFECPSGSLPSNSETNPREHLKAVSLRSGKQFEARAKEGPGASNEEVAVREDPSSSEDASEKNAKKPDEDVPKPPIPKVPEYKPTVPYPAR